MSVICKLVRLQSSICGGEKDFGLSSVKVNSLLVHWTIVSLTAGQMIK